MRKQLSLQQCHPCPISTTSRPGCSAGLLAAVPARCSLQSPPAAVVTALLPPHHSPSLGSALVRVPSAAAHV